MRTTVVLESFLSATMDKNIVVLVLLVVCCGAAMANFGPVSLNGLGSNRLNTRLNNRNGLNNWGNNRGIGNLGVLGRPNLRNTAGRTRLRNSPQDTLDHLSLLLPGK